MAKYEISLTGKFKKELKQAKKRGLPLDDLFEVVGMLADDTPLPQKHHDHELHGNYEGYRECHIHPDWLLIYEKQTTLRILSLYRTGTHSDLF